MPPPVELIPDIWDLIIDTLGNGIDSESNSDATSLRNLALTCKAMVSPCRKRLFSSIISHAMMPFDNSSAARFLKLATRDPTIIDYVRYVAITIWYPRDVGVQRFFEILGKSTTLRSLELTGVGRQWNRYPEPLQTALERLIRLPSVTALALGWLESVPSSIFLGSNHITHLTLSHAAFTHNGHDDRDANITKDNTSIPRPIFLRLVNDSRHGLVSLMYPNGRTRDERVVDFSGLRELKINLDDKGAIEAMQEVLQISRELQSLYLYRVHNTQTVSWAGLGGSLSKWKVATLKKLTLRGISAGSEVNDPLGDLVPELGMIAGMNIVEEIYLEVVFDNVRCRPDTDDWSALDTLLTRPGSFPRLTAVTIKIQWIKFDHSAEDPASIPDDITEGDFPRLSDSKVVKFDFLCAVSPFR